MRFALIGTHQWNILNSFLFALKISFAINDETLEIKSTLMLFQFGNFFSSDDVYHHGDLICVLEFVEILHPDYSIFEPRFPWTFHFIITHWYFSSLIKFSRYSKFLFLIVFSTSKSFFIRFSTSWFLISSSQYPVDSKNSSAVLPFKSDHY